MKIGYPCKNIQLATTHSKTFRLASYSEERLCEAVLWNLEGLGNILEFNAEAGFLVFRLSSDIVPFASHDVCTMDWRERFQSEFSRIAERICHYEMRVSTHPGQFILLNSPREEVVVASFRELDYHAAVLDLVGADSTGRIQIHLGGTYGDKPAAIDRFAETFPLLPEKVRNRLVVENDERQYSLADCLVLYEKIGIPILFDAFHHLLFNNGESYAEALRLVSRTWDPVKDGVPLVDYSNQAEGKQKGAHTDHIDLADFRQFLTETREFDFDIMLEIKDKETSATDAVRVAKEIRDDIETQTPSLRVNSTASWKLSANNI